MLEIDHLNLLSLTIALSAYVGAVRLAVLGRLTANPPPQDTQKERLKKFLRLLIPADAALVLASFLTFLLIFWTDMFGGVAPACLNPAIVWSFFFGVVVLILHHGYSWYKSLA